MRYKHGSSVRQPVSAIFIINFECINVQCIYLYFQCSYLYFHCSSFYFQEQYLQAIYETKFGLQVQVQHRMQAGQFNDPVQQRPYRTHGLYLVTFGSEFEFINVCDCIHLYFKCICLYFHCMYLYVQCIYLFCQCIYLFFKCMYLYFLCIYLFILSMHLLIF